MYLQAGDILYLVKGEKAPVDAMILSTAYEDGTCFVETAELDGETNLKRRTALTELCTTTTPESVSALKGRIECEQPNENLHKFNGRLIFQSPESQGEISKSLNMDHLILRGAVLRNTDFAYAIVVYTGSDTKIIKNLKPAKAKTSTLERQLNYFVGGAFVFNAFLLISSVVIDYVGFIQILNLQKERQLTEPYDYAIAWYIGPVQDSAATELKNSILSYFALYSYVIPISLFVTMEVVRLVQGMFMTWDKKMESTLTSDDGSPPKVIAMRANNTNLNEEMAQLDYIFSDKTGTFTKNEMKLARWFVDETVYDEMNESGSLGRAMQDVRNISCQISLCVI